MNALPCIKHLSTRESIRVYAAYLNNSNKVKIFGIKYTVTASSLIGALFPTWNQCWNTATRTVKTPVFKGLALQAPNTVSERNVLHASEFPFSFNSNIPAHALNNNHKWSSRTNFHPFKQSICLGKILRRWFFIWTPQVP